jgi:ubiquitin-protein ligase
MSDISLINDNFIHSYTEFSNQNSLMTILIVDTAKISFILYIARKAFETIDSDSSRFEPNPLVYFQKIYQDDNTTKEDIAKFFNIVKDEKDFFKMLISCCHKGSNTTDTEMIEVLKHITPIGITFIKLLYFFIFTNTIAFNSVNVGEVEKDTKTKVFLVSHGTEKETEFYNIPGKSIILMHGSHISNMYSIMRNGIKSMSNSKYKTNGAVYGEGIYLSDNIHTVMSYGREDKGKINKGKIIVDDINDEKEESTCILFFNCKNLNDSSNKKSNGYCYVQQENEIILRCILWIDKNTTKLGYKNYEEPEKEDLIDKVTNFAKNIKFTPTITAKMEEPSSTVLADKNLLKLPSSEDFALSGERVIQGKRLVKEVDKFMKMIGVPGENTLIKANFLNPDDMKTPLMVLIKPSPDTELYQDLIKYNIPGLLLSIWFPNGPSAMMEFPFTPLRMRLVSPMLVDGSGLITRGGSICSDQLYSDGWSPANTIESIIRNFATTVATEGARSGGGRVDIDRLGKYYKYSDYQVSYDFVAGVHGWK